MVESPFRSVSVPRLDLWMEGSNWRAVEIDATRRKRQPSRYVIRKCRAIRIGSIDATGIIRPTTTTTHCGRNVSEPPRREPPAGITLARLRGRRGILHHGRPATSRDWPRLSVRPNQLWLPRQRGPDNRGDGEGHELCILSDAVPSRMLKIAANPGGVAMDVIGEIRANVSSAVCPFVPALKSTMLIGYGRLAPGVDPVSRRGPRCRKQRIRPPGDQRECRIPKLANKATPIQGASIWHSLRTEVA
jgi:hypothetical protein